LKSRTKDVSLYNVQTARSTVTPNHTVPTLQDASNVLPIILLPPAQSLETNHQPAPSVEVITQLTTEAAKSTKTFKVFNTVKILQIKNIIYEIYEMMLNIILL